MEEFGNPTSKSSNSELTSVKFSFSFCRAVLVSSLTLGLRVGVSTASALCTNLWPWKNTEVEEPEFQFRLDVKQFSWVLTEKPWVSEQVSVLPLFLNQLLALAQHKFKNLSFNSGSTSGKVCLSFCWAVLVGGSLTLGLAWDFGKLLST